MKKNGIRHQTPEQNGIAERCNRSIMERARTMIKAANLNHKY